MTTNTAATHSVKVRSSGQRKGAGIYSVTAGQQVIGYVTKVEQGETYWIATLADGKETRVGGANRTRADAVRTLCDATLTA